MLFAVFDERAENLTLSLRETVSLQMEKAPGAGASGQAGAKLSSIVALLACRSSPGRLTRRSETARSVAKPGRHSVRSPRAHICGVVVDVVVRLSRLALWQRRRRQTVSRVSATAARATRRVASEGRPRIRLNRRSTLTRRVLFAESRQSGARRRDAAPRARQHERWRWRRRRHQTDDAGVDGVGWQSNLCRAARIESASLSFLFLSFFVTLTKILQAVMAVFTEDGRRKLVRVVATTSAKEAIDVGTQHPQTTQTIVHLI